MLEVLESQEKQEKKLAIIIIISEIRASGG
jgi:hypothetical protein